ncbi:glucose-6-phosphate isomerase [Vineibacter terrae]|uniref:glucose-6-phosphate isomerase n=1 Tax=Vineibacter terrae TaxID=2586908 RepID=UPI002E317756|nr:glucose-6-phosphate isomerase [Vineibacter terrae]HEX2886292.1 glucose-6-phosphate isomerase [Vineibacter terrae]
MLYQHQIDDVFSEAIGGNGLSQRAFERELEQALPAQAGIRSRHEDGSLPLLRLPAARDDLAALKPHVERLRQFAHVVILGTGGSSLGGQTLAALNDIGFGPAQGAPKLWFMDNVDPATFAELLTRLDLAKTAFVPISKSGGTAETLTQLFVVLEALEAKLGKGKVADHLLTITEPKDNALRRIAQRVGGAILDHDPGVGGRFSVLSLVGLLPAMIAGLDAAAIREGAASVLDPLLAAGEETATAPTTGAALSVALWRERGAGTTVLMPYVDRLAYFGLWFRQLWAESLGKNGYGTTPIRAMGTVDQHSQLQLYLDGPADKLFTLVIRDTAGEGTKIRRAALDGDDSLTYLADRSLGDLLLAEANATAATLARNGRPTRTLRIAHLDERVMGALLMHFMLETIIAADLLRVDAFDQPAVEEGKVLTRKYLAGQK